MRIGHRRRLTTVAVGRRAGHRTGALRPHPQRAEPVDTGDRAATGTDAEHVDLRQVDRHPGRLAGKPDLWHLVQHQADVGGGAAHVEGERVLLAHQRSQPRTADHAGGRPRGGQADRQLPRSIGGGHAAVGLHQVQRHRHTLVGHLGADRTEVGAQQWQERCVQGGGGGANVLAELRYHLTRQRHRHPRKLLGQDLADSLLVGGIQEREQHHHGDRLHGLLSQQRGGLLDARLVKLINHHPFRIDAARHADAQMAGDDRLGLRRPQVVHVPAHLRADGKHVLEPVVRDQRCAGEPALDDRVGGDGGSMREVADVGSRTGGAL